LARLDTSLQVVKRPLRHATRELFDLGHYAARSPPALAIFLALSTTVFFGIERELRQR